MPNILGWKWGDSVLGTTGGVVTWSYTEELPENHGGTCVCITTTIPGQDPEPINDIDREPEIITAFQQWADFGNIVFMEVPAAETTGSRQKVDIRFHFDGTSDEELSVTFTPDQSGDGLGGDIQINAAPA